MPPTYDIPDEYLVEIGRVTVRWSLLESVLDLCLIKLAGKDILEKRSQIIFNHMAFPMKLDVMGAFVSTLLPGYPALSGFPAIQRLLKKAQEHRNSVIHGRWGFDETTREVTISRLSARGKLKFSITPVSIAEISAMTDLIVKASHDLHSLVTKAGTTNIPPQMGQ